MKQIFVLTAFLVLAGCAKFTADVKETSKDGTVKQSKVRATAFFDSKSEVMKVSAGQTDKSQRIGVGGINQETSATNVVRSLELINAILSKGAMGL